MRFAVTMLLWLVTTVALAVAVPSAWLQRNVIDADGYASFAQSAAHNPRLQDAMASELTTQVMGIAENHSYDVNESLVRGVAAAYTAGPSFPGQFGRANRIIHQWMFTNSARTDSQNRWVIDLSPMLSENSFRQTLSDLNVQVPSTLTVPVAASQSGLRPGQLRLVASWGPWVSIGAAVLAGVAALLTLVSARQRGKALAALGVSALLVGAGGWAALAAEHDRINTALDRTTGDIRRIADVMVAHAEGSLHQWFNLTLAAGGVLVVFGIIATMLGALRRRG